MPEIDMTNILADAPSGILPPPSTWPVQTVEIERRVPKAAMLDGDRLHVSRVEKRRMMDRRSESNAEATIDRLPERGECFHIISGGNWHGFSLVPLCCKLIAPAVIDELIISTLSFNSGNTDRLIGLLDTGTVRSVVMLASVYFRDTSGREYGELAAKLADRGYKLAAVRTHAKIIVMRTTGGDHIVIESSANLRSCRNIEQYTIANDQELYDFHRNWITELIEKAEANE